MRTTTTHTGRVTFHPRHRARFAMPTLAVVAMLAAACSAPPSDQPAPAAGEAPAADQAQESAPAATTAERPDPASAAPRAAAAAPAPAPVAAPAPAAPPPPPKPRVAHLNTGHVFTIRTTREISTKTAKTGDVFSAILEEPITAGDWTVAGAGAKVDGRIVESDKGGRVKGKASLTLELTNLTLADGRKIEVVTSPTGTEAATNKSGDAKKIGVGAGAGAAVGAIAGGGKGAVVGGLIGAGAGTAMRGDDAVLPAESVVAFELRSPLTIEEQKRR